MADDLSVASAGSKRSPLEELRSRLRSSGNSVATPDSIAPSMDGLLKKYSTTTSTPKDENAPPPLNISINISINNKFDRRKR